jgi:hypothetical protein
LSETDQYDRMCKAEFAAIHTKLDRLDEAIRGNGRVGIQLRLDRLEAAEAVLLAAPVPCPRWSRRSVLTMNPQRPTVAPAGAYPCGAVAGQVRWRP